MNKQALLNIIFIIFLVFNIIQISNLSQKLSVQEQRPLLTLEQVKELDSIFGLNVAQSMIEAGRQNISH